MRHTHRGTCQACGRPTAMQLRNDKIAKHGYTVDWGFFNGVCCGSENAPLEVEKTLTENVIKSLDLSAQASDQLAADLRSGKAEPKFYNLVRKAGRGFFDEEKVYCTRSEVLPNLSRGHYMAEQAIKSQIAAAIYQEESNARHARSHAKMLGELIASRHGQPLYPVEPEKAKVLIPGVKVQMWGKKDGIVCEVIEIRGQRASGVGPYLNGQFIDHAVLKRPDGSQFAYPVRLIRKSSIIENA